MTTRTLAYARTHTAAYVSDKIAGLMKRLVNAFGFDPRGVADAWTEWIDLAARTWMESGHLIAFKIQFHMPGETLVRGGFEFPIRYDGNGEADLYVDEDHFRESIAKAERRLLERSTESFWQRALALLRSRESATRRPSRWEHSLRARRAASSSLPISWHPRGTTENENDY